MKSLDILVTGASSGIGQRTAQLLAERGHRVVGAARRTDRIPTGSGIRPLFLDLTDESRIKNAAKEIGAIDVLINCAGFGGFGSIEDLPMAAARIQLEVNLLGAAALSQALLPGMRAQGWGRIINVSSLAGEFAGPMAGWYHASKFALEGLSDSLRGEVRQFGVDVVLIQPGYVATDWHDHAMTSLSATSGHGVYASMAQAMQRYFASSTVARQTASIDDVATVIVEAALTSRPRTRYRVGPGAKVAVALATVLPDRAFDALTRKQFDYQ